MIIYALKDGIKISVNKSGEQAQCPKCKKEVRAIMGEHNKHHWRHVIDNPDCTGRISDSWKKDQVEGYYTIDPTWHDDMKLAVEEYCKIKNIECEIEKTYDKNGIIHRTDACVNNINIEFQRSYISLQEIEEREKFYGDMIWVIHEDLYSKKINSFSKPFYYFKNGKLYNYLDKEFEIEKESPYDNIIRDSVKNEKLYNLLTINKNDKEAVEKLNGYLENIKTEHKEIFLIIDQLKNYKEDCELASLLCEKIDKERMLVGLIDKGLELNKSLEDEGRNDYNNYHNKIQAYVETQENTLKNVLVNKQNELLEYNKILEIENNKILNRMKQKDDFEVNYNNLKKEIYETKNLLASLLHDYKIKYPYKKSKKIIELENNLSSIKNKIKETKLRLREIKEKIE